ncbi:monooxygenase [Streptomyces yokosukanensis]|uniref:Monooxygenase n=1 Tax=Streptomyces yokosukanensis TaxID=67386 RepID=A0A101NM34_9ACTN|nr:flavin reductase family protein [Streptomyces yokosukanensis]KUM95459.1 monooxygenase [Streptomyces yokosukanensis]
MTHPAPRSADVCGRTIEAAEFRSALSLFASGLTVVASLDEYGRPVGLACQSFSSLSLDPQLILVCIGKGSSSWPRIAPTGHFSVSILAAEQQEVCAALGRPGQNKFQSIPWRPTTHGTVRIDGSLAALDCRIRDVHEAGDHLVVIGEVLDLATRDDGVPLLFFRSSFAKGLAA